MRRSLVLLASAGVVTALTGAALVAVRAAGSDHDPYIDPVRNHCPEVLQSYVERGLDLVGPSGWGRADSADSTDPPGLAHGARRLRTGDTVVAVSRRGERDTAVVTLDVTDPAAPRVVHTAAVVGADLVAARVRGGVVRLVLRAALPELAFVVPDADTSPREAERANRDLVEHTTIDDWLPRAAWDGAAATRVGGLACDRVARPDRTGAPLTTLVVACFEAARPTSFSTIAGPPASTYAGSMCRNIRPLNNFEPPASDDEVTAAALQFVRKVSGTTKPSAANQAAFDAAVHEIAHITRHLVDELVTTAPPKDREVEAAKARERAALRYAR